MIAPMEPVAAARGDTFELTIQHAHDRWSAKFVVTINGHRHGGVLNDATSRSLLEFTNACGEYLMQLADGDSPLVTQPPATMALVLG